MVGESIKFWTAWVKKIFNWSYFSLLAQFENHLEMEVVFFLATITNGATPIRLLEWYGQIHLCILMEFVQPLICQDCMDFLGQHHKGHHCFTHKWPACAFNSFFDLWWSLPMNWVENDCHYKKYSIYDPYIFYLVLHFIVLYLRQRISYQQ